MYCGPVIDPEVVCQQTFIQKVTWFSEIDSTNTLALSQLETFDCLPILIGADKQTGGRGRGQNSWYAGSGGLTFSVILRPVDFQLEHRHWPLMSLFVGLAIREAISQFVTREPVSLKWPNDIYLGERKVCGVLIESAPQHRDMVVIGIGLNVNNSFDGAPDDIRCRAVSMSGVEIQLFNRQLVLVEVLKSLEEVLQTAANSVADLLTEWRSHCFLTGRRIKVDEIHRTVTGNCLGIDQEGALLLQTDEKIERLFAGSVTLL